MRHSTRCLPFSRPAPGPDSIRLPRPRMPRALVGLTLAAMLGVASSASGAIVRVGSDPGCDASTIQGGVDIAMARPGTDTVEVARGNYIEQVTIDGNISPDLIIVQGGYDGCTGTHVGSATGLFGFEPGGAALEIGGGAGVVIADMQVSKSDGLAMLVTSPDTDVTLQNAEISQSGLGVFVSHGAALVVDLESRILGNENLTGPAGILCALSDAGTPRIFVQGLVAFNTSSRGGGIWASSGCQVTLAGAHFRNNVASEGGGAIYLEDGARLTTLEGPIVNVFRDNTAERGGAIYLTDASMTLDHAEIHANQASRGGGIYAQVAAEVTLGGSVAIFDNLATRQGGGIAANTVSLITLRDGVTIRDNRATDNGGGVYLASSADLSGAADGSRGIEITGNVAAYGGGLYLTGDGTSAILQNVHVRGNEARFAGGGAAVRFSAFLRMNRGADILCANPPRCSVLSENVLTDGANGGDGSALFVDTGADAQLYQTYIERNRHQIHAAASRVVQARDDGTGLRLEGIQLWANDATALIGADDGAEVEAGFLTAARNAWSLDENTELPVFGAMTSGGGSLTLASSILVDTRGYDGTLVSECLIVDDDSGLTPNPTIAVGVDPRLVDPGIGDLHLRGDSPAIDYCDTTVLAPEDPLDLDLEARGVDHPEFPSILGLYDLGMDETLESPPIFADGFESGNISAWSNG